MSSSASTSTSVTTSGNGERNGKYTKPVYGTRQFADLLQTGKSSYSEYGAYYYRAEYDKVRSFPLRFSSMCGRQTPPNERTKRKREDTKDANSNIENDNDINKPTLC
jgi:hypothetical protein